MKRPQLLLGKLGKQETRYPRQRLVKLSHIGREWRPVLDCHESYSQSVDAWIRLTQLHGHPPFQVMQLRPIAEC